MGVCGTTMKWAQNYQNYFCLILYWALMYQGMFSFFLTEIWEDIAVYFLWQFTVIYTGISGFPFAAHCESETELDASDGWTAQLHDFFIELFKPIALNLL